MVLEGGNPTPFVANQNWVTNSNQISNGEGFFKTAYFYNLVRFRINIWHLITCNAAGATPGETVTTVNTATMT